MVNKKIKSTGGRSSYYDIIFNEDELSMIRSIKRFNYDTLIKNMFDDDPLYKKFVDCLLVMGGPTIGNHEVLRIKLNVEQVDRALVEGKLSLDDVFKALFNNDFDYCTILKSLKRAYEDLSGRGKLGADAKYNFGKIRYSLNQLKKHYIDGNQNENIIECELALNKIEKYIKE